MERRLAAILVADVVGYSRLMGADEAETLGRLKMLRKDLVQPCIENRKGRIVKLMGDGLLAEFPSVVEAVQCAVEIQERIVGREADAPEASRIILRIGINLGDIIVEGSDIYGDGVNVAARLEGLADPGGICLSAATFQAIEGKLQLAFEDMGLQELNYASDYRSFRRSSKRWDFEVHSSDPGARIVLSWEGAADKLRNSVLTDRETRRRIRPRADGRYAFSMNGNSRAFTWKVRR